jgi:hypothetical protein
MPIYKGSLFCLFIHWLVGYNYCLFIKNIVLDLPVERSTSCCHKRVRVLGRDGDQTHGASKDEDCV